MSESIEHNATSVEETNEVAPSDLEPAPMLTVIIPTYNEADNIAPLIDRLQRVLEGIDWELCFVDDNSPDQTAKVIQSYAQKDRRIRCIRRLNRRGLSSACIEGFLATSAPYIAVMDADLQHDENLLPKLFSMVNQETCELAVASRYLDDAETIDALGAQRTGVSRLAIRMSRLLKIEQLSDPVSGFFCFRRSSFASCFGQLYGEGFKILIDLVSSVEEPITVKELGYTMRHREAGQSKLDVVIVMQYLTMLFYKLTRGLVPIKFLMFILVGASGVVVHLSVLLSLRHLGVETFFIAQLIATWVAMTSNFFINNVTTYKDQRLHGKALLLGLLSFYVVCSIGAIVNLGFSSLLEANGFTWVISGTMGAAVGAVWNYTISSLFTWGDRRASD